MTNTLNSAARHTEIPGDRSLAVASREPRSYLVNVGGTQLGMWRRVTARRARSSFRLAVRHVLRLCSEKEMIGPAAKSIVAVMADRETAGNRPVRKSPSYSMRALGMAAHGEPAVAEMVGRSLPLPATVTLFDMRPKAPAGLTSERVPALPRAAVESIATVFAVKFGGGSVKALAAVVTNQCYCWASHCVNSSREFALWLGSRGVCKPLASRSYFSTVFTLGA